MGPGRKRIRKSRAKNQQTVNSVVDQVTDWMDATSQLSVYPGVMSALFPDFDKRRPSQRAASKRARDKVSIFVKDDDGDGDGDEIDGAAEGATADKISSRRKKRKRSNAADEEEYDPDKDETFADPDVDDYDFVPDSLDPDFDTSDMPMPPLSAPPPPALNTQNGSTTLPSLGLNNNGDAIANNSGTSTPVTPAKIGNGGGVEKQQLTESDTKEPPKKKKRKKKVDNPLPIKPAGPTIVDIRPLVEEVRAGRYPSMKVFNGKHTNICFFCKTEGPDVLHCEFCINSEHMGCLKSKVSIRDLEPDDEFMCHRCIQTVLARRARAERRRLDKLNEAMKAASGGTGSSSPVGLSLEQAKQAVALKREVVWSQSEFDQHVSTYSKCPTGGPGGLICCGACTANYSRFLSETAKEMEVQTLSGVGREVSELLELLHDAQDRLKQALDVSTGNDIKRSMLSRRGDAAEEGTTSSDASGAFGASSTIMGIMDIFGKK